MKGYFLNVTKLPVNVMKTGVREKCRDEFYSATIFNGIEVGIALENILNIKWNEAQFATESRLKNEPAPVTELNFTPGTPFFARIKFVVFF